MRAARDYDWSETEKAGHDLTGLKSKTVNAGVPPLLSTRERADILDNDN